MHLDWWVASFPVLPHFFPVFRFVLPDAEESRSSASVYYCQHKPKNGVFRGIACISLLSLQYSYCKDKKTGWKPGNDALSTYHIPSFSLVPQVSGLGTRLTMRAL